MHWGLLAGRRSADARASLPRHQHPQGVSSSCRQGVTSRCRLTAPPLSAARYAFRLTKRSAEEPIGWRYDKVTSFWKDDIPILRTEHTLYPTVDRLPGMEFTPTPLRAREPGRNLFIRGNPPLSVWPPTLVDRDSEILAFSRALFSSSLLGSEPESRKPNHFIEKIE
jgi:hypothetical protein